MKDKGTTIFSLVTVAVVLCWTFALMHGQSNWTPTFANNLARQSEARSEGGDRAGALDASRRAAEVYRRLARTNPMHYAPYLAASLHNLAVLLDGDGNKAGALAAIDEAIAIRHRLAKANPVRYTGGLEQSLQRLSHIETSRSNAANKVSVVDDR
jgi:hypothetical protein